MSGDYASYVDYCYKDGEPYGLCDRCNYKRRILTELKTEWTSLKVCQECLDPKPPQLEAPNVFPEGLPVDQPRPNIEQSGPNETSRNDL